MSYVDKYYSKHSVLLHPFLKVLLMVPSNARVSSFSFDPHVYLSFDMLFMKKRISDYFKLCSESDDCNRMFNVDLLW